MILEGWTISKKLYTRGKGLRLIKCVCFSHTEDSFFCDGVTRQTECTRIWTYLHLQQTLTYLSDCTDVYVLSSVTECLFLADGVNYQRPRYVHTF